MSEQNVILEPGFDPDALRAKHREERDKLLRDEGNASHSRLYHLDGRARTPTTERISCRRKSDYQGST